MHILMGLFMCLSLLRLKQQLNTTIQMNHKSPAIGYPISVPTQDMLIGQKY